MFDSRFFVDTLPKQIAEMGGGVTCEMALHDGGSLTVHRIGEVADGYVILQVYPGEEIDEESMRARKREPANAIVWDRLAVPFESICGISLSVTRPDAARQYGFVTGT